MSLASAAHRFGKDVNLFGMQLAVRALVCSGTNEVTRLDVARPALAFAITLRSEEP